ncbi:MULTISPECIES: DUF6891 domain-containing protein [Streptomyces]|uniref:DUF6891 domain-containing protein n=2 Tax=Streptomyces griseiscabiei TaxID=2993540 RepID=A0ABU4KX24_9ACTN|nr:MULTISPECIES: hypothetical protein [Streptomyces]MBZ3903273.1 hypothetical protein [Streptomyces griseiscabiei]MDX2907584.1 hypothetical protein [Streptomyces griseiscabiei]
MKIDGGDSHDMSELAVRVDTENWEKHARITGGRLRELVLRIGDHGDRFLVVQRIPDVPDVFVQVWHQRADDGTAGEYQLEHREGRDRFFGAVLTDPERVAEAMTGWARRAAGWDTGIEWTPVEHDAPEEVPDLPDDVRDQVEERVRELLRCGYDDRARLSETAEEYLVDGDERPVSPAQARQLVDRLWVERLAEQETWDGVTDPERLTRAFETLRAAHGITAREHFTCCRSCGMSEIGAEGPPDAPGFVFFHTQCTEGAAAGHGLMLLYGGFDGSAETTAAVGHQVVAALAAEGLSTQWDGDPGTAVAVTPLDWRKRLVG